MAGKGLLIILIGSIVVAGVIFSTMFRQNETAFANAVDNYRQQTVRNIAQSGVLMAVRALNDAPQWRTGYSNIAIQGGFVSVRLNDTTFNGESLIKVVSTGSSGTRSSAISHVTTAYVRRGYIPSTIKGAVTSNSNVQTLGNMTLDGREHDINGNLISNSGTYAIWTTQNLSQSGNSYFGGTHNGVDYVPANPGNSQIYYSNQTYPGGFPSTPDSVLGGSPAGFPQGTLKSIAQSGLNGSQYATNPSNLTLPLKGVTFVELPDGSNWGAGGLDLTGSGILIVHNSTKTAQVQNLNTGTFKGIILVDDVIRIQTTIIGAIIIMSPNPPSGNCIGNGNGSILYSTQAIYNAIGNISSGTQANSLTAKVVLWDE